LAQVAESISKQWPQLSLHFDLAELRGYHYHTGIVFAAYVPGHGRALANGGRYDGVGEVFGRARPATGFATDLKALMGLLPMKPVATAIHAPLVTSDNTAGLQQEINRLRMTGEIVISSLDGSIDPRCDRQLIPVDSSWVVQQL
jgi:ATP phosphoribosyltransferase regulatory subunit